MSKTKKNELEELGHPIENNYLFDVRITMKEDDTMEVFSIKKKDMYYEELVKFINKLKDVSPQLDVSERDEGFI